MKNKPKDWQPLPEVYRKAREEEQAAALERFRVKQAEHRAGARARGALRRRRTAANRTRAGEALQGAII